MKMQSITQRLITVVLLLEFFSALVLIAVMVLYESHIHMQAFDVMLRGHADSLFGAVQDADDAADSVMFDNSGVTLAKDDVFDVDEAGHSLGQSTRWPERQVRHGLENLNRNGIFRASLNGESYRFIVIHGVRVVDPGASDGGVAHPIRVIYGAPTRQVWHQVLETVRFYIIATLLLMTLTAAAMAWFLSRGMAPLRELAEEAGNISAQQWSFHPPASARRTKELAPLASALEAALSRLQQAFSQQKRLTSNAAHELKTDIAVSKSSLQLLSMKPRTVEEYRQGLEICVADCLHLEETVQRMLTLARAESTGPDTRSAGSDASACARESVQQLAALAELCRVNVILDASEGAIVPLDANDCTILCTNLLHNAIVHSKPDSSVTITVAAADNWAILTVQDSGDGISPEALPHVFEPFYRGDLSRDRRSGSTGLGLAICKAMCEGVDGSITLTSQVGSGTLVTVRLPITVGAHKNPSETIHSFA